ncbi:MAG: Crp/Fnr family transcriptional regulator [Candidatus Izemoplasma sp.]|nr:Crp/Fnr family transcriptional regulator [Candidatus Izemoplasma sp.]
MSRFCNTCIYETLPSRQVNIKKGEFIFHQGDDLHSIFYIRDGIVKITKLHEDGEEKILELVGRDDFIGLLAVLRNQTTYPASAECLTDVTMTVSSKADTLQAYEDHQPFKEACMHCATTRADVFQSQLFQLSNRSTDDKIVGFLTQLAQRFGTYKNDQYCVELPLTQQELASIIGLRRETLSRRLNALKDESIIDFKGSKYIIK